MNINMIEQEIIKCPLCQSGDITVLIKEKSFTTKRTRCRAGCSSTTRVNHGYIEALTGCPSCHASNKDIETKLKGGKYISVSEAAKRAQNAGLPTRI